MLFFVIVNSFATTTISLVSNLIGAKQIEKVIPTYRHVITLNYAFGIPLTMYWTAEQLYVIVLLVLSLWYFKRNKWQDKNL
ncbi:hypothetical protein SDC9_90204 [bioreactor metagenome]|uniref:Uncharacterized protein n=1 Tax=bioreactor metagenome TaxID=1076179 RepID=A0A644ZRZ1_9ZZZZ